MRIFYRYIVKPTYIFKVLVIGDREVGRGTFLRESVDDFPFFEEYIDTVGVNIYKKELTFEGGMIDLKIWNVSNKEIGRSLLRPYITGSDAALLMFDITNSQSFAFLTDFPQMIRERSGEIPILLVGNKVDLGKERVISKKEGTAFAKIDNLLGYIEISAKVKQDCEKILKLLAEKILAMMV